MHPCNYLKKVSVETDVVTDKGLKAWAEMELDTEQKMKLEWLYIVGSECKLDL